MLGIYCRISKIKKLGKDVSISNQKEEGVKFAKKLGMKYKFFIDEGISGNLDEIEDRPAFTDLFSAIKNGEVDAVYAYDQSRIERNTRIWNFFVYIMLEHKCEYYPNGKSYDLNDPDNRLISNIVSATNEFFAAITGKKVKLAINKNAKAGKTHGLNSFGYERDKDGFFKINKDEAKIVKRIYQLSLEGNGAYTIANILNAEKIPTKFNKFSGVIKRKDEYTGKITEFNKKDVVWRGNVIHDMIRNPIYKGKRRWKEDEINVPYIVEEEYWEKVNKNLKENKKKAGKREEYRYLLNGLMSCADCNSEYRGKKRLKGSDNAYKCNGKSFYQSICKTSRGISIPKLETFIIHHLFFDKELGKFLKSFPAKSEDTNRLKAKLNKLQVELSQTTRKIKNAYTLLLESDFADDTVIKDELIKSKKRESDLKDNINIIQTNLLEIENDYRLKRTKRLIGEYSFDSDFDTTKKLIHSLIEKITIKHNKESKGGFFLLEIKYRGFEEQSLFSTNWQALTWLWINRYRANATNKTELDSDKKDLQDLYNYFGIKKKISSGFKGLEIIENKASIITLINEELIQFE